MPQDKRAKLPRLFAAYFAPEHDVESCSEFINTSASEKTGVTIADER